VIMFQIQITVCAEWA